MDLYEKADANGSIERGISGAGGDPALPTLTSDKRVVV